MSEFSRQVQRHRIALGLAVQRAAREAGVDRATWTAWEAGRSRPTSASWAGIERTLRWQSGSVDVVLGGGKPTPADLPPEPDRRDPLTGETYTGVEGQLWDLRHAFAEHWAKSHGEEEAAELGAERAREHIRLSRLQHTMTRKGLTLPEKSQ